MSAYEHKAAEPRQPRRYNKAVTSASAAAKKDGAAAPAGPARDAAACGLEVPSAPPRAAVASGTEKQGPPPVGAKAADVPPTSALAALGQAAAASAAATKRTPEPAARKGGAVVGRLGSMLVYVETEAKNAYEPVRVWLVETSAKVRGSIEARAGPVVQKLQALGQPVVVYVTPVYAKVTDGVLSVRTAVGDRMVAVRSRALQLKGACAGRALAAYGAACEAADVRYKAACGLVGAKMAPVSARCLEFYRAGEAKALPYYVKAKDTTVLYCQKAKGGAQYVQTRVGDIVLKIKVGAGDTAALVKHAMMSRCAAVSDFVRGYVGPVAAKLAAMYEAVIAHVSNNLSAIVAKALGGKTLVYTKACDVAVVVKVKSLAIKEKALNLKGKAMEYPSALLVQVKDGYVYVKTVVDGKIVVIKAKFSDVLASFNSTLLQVKEQATLKAANAFDTAHVKYLALRAGTRRIAADPNARVAAASAVGGATVMGAGGGVAGLVAGGTLGAACGVPLSLFTFGLSIPVGAVVGSAAGMCTGAVAGGTAGLVGGGAAGHKIHQKKDSIAEGFSAAASKIIDIKGRAVETASLCKTKVVDSTEASASYVRSRFAGGTGGTGEDK